MKTFHYWKIISIFAFMEKIINKWKINKSLLAEKMGMTNTTFNKKLSNNSFDDAELIQLKMILKELRDDLSDIIDIDFNETLKLMVKK
jgi:DNA-binding Xre family transcriptional regulator